MRYFDPLDRQVGGFLVLTNGGEFWFEDGHIQGFRCPRSYFELQDPDRIPHFYGHAKISRDEVVRFARQSILDLGYSLEDTYGNLEPEVIKAKCSSGEIPFYRVEFPFPNHSGPSAQIEVDASKPRVVALHLYGRNFDRPPPRTVIPPPMMYHPKHYADDLTEGEMAEFYARSPIVDRYATNLSIPIQVANWTNDVKRGLLNRGKNGIRGWVCLKNGYELSFQYGVMREFDAPDRFYNMDKVKVKDFTGKVNLSERAMIRLAKSTVSKMGLSPEGFGMNKKPEITKPYIEKPIIPRFVIKWENITPDGNLMLV